MKALIIYYTKTGHTEQAAKDIARGLESAGVGTVVMPAENLRNVSVKDHDVVAVGTPTYGHRRYQQPAKWVKVFLDSLSPNGLEGKVCGAFAVYAGVGGSKLVKSLEKTLQGLGATVVEGGPAVQAGAPLSLWKGPDASSEDVRMCEEFGKLLAEAAGAEE